MSATMSEGQALAVSRARHARALVAAERRYQRRAKAYEQGRRSTELVDTQRLALLLVDADRLVRSLAGFR